MPSPESRTMVQAMPQETEYVLKNMEIPSVGASGIEIAIELVKEPKSLYEPVNGMRLTIADTLITDPEIVLDEVILNEQSRTIIQALNELSESEQFVIAAKYQDGLSNTEIGRHFGKSRDFVSKLHHSALAKLRSNPQLAEVYGYEQ